LIFLPLLGFFGESMLNEVTLGRRPWRYLSLGMIFVGVGLVLGALWVLLRPLVTPPVAEPANPTQDFTALALSRAAQGDVESALQALDIAIAADPDGAFQAYYYRGLIHAQQEDFQAALADFNQALSINPHMVEAYAARGTTYVSMGRPITALDDFNKALELKPDDAETLVNRGHAYMELSMYDLALADFNRAIELDSSLVAAYFNRGVLYLTQEQPQKALADFNTCIELDPKLPGPYFNRAAAYLALGEQEKAIADLKIYLGLAQSEENRQKAETLLESLTGKGEGNSRKPQELP